MKGELYFFVSGLFCDHKISHVGFDRKKCAFDFELNRIKTSVELNKNYSMNSFLYVFKLTAATVAYPCCLWAK